MRCSAAIDWGWDKGLNLASRSQPDGGFISLPIKFVGLGEPAEHLQAFDAKQFVEALFSEKE